jgi:hypothetical protein
MLTVSDNDIWLLVNLSKTRAMFMLANINRIAVPHNVLGVLLKVPRAQTNRAAVSRPQVTDRSVLLMGIVTL